MKVTHTTAVGDTRQQKNTIILGCSIRPRSTTFLAVFAHVPGVGGILYCENACSSSSYLGLVHHNFTAFCTYFCVFVTRQNISLDFHQLLSPSHATQSIFKCGYKCCCWCTFVLFYNNTHRECELNEEKKTFFSAT